MYTTPGWQYWNKDPKFAQLVHKNTREIIRRDRNHPSVLMWEPILNETSYPLDFALEALKITKDEYPYEGRPVAAADVHSAGVAEHMTWFTAGRVMMRSLAVPNSVFLLVSLVRMWMIGMLTTITIVLAAVGENVRS